MTLALIIMFPLIVMLSEIIFEAGILTGSTVRKSVNSSVCI
jgi:hypothetical protein